MNQDPPKSGAPAPDRRSIGYLPPLDPDALRPGGRGVRQDEKRIHSVECPPPVAVGPKKRGGQPGNRNALKHGRATAAHKDYFRQARAFRRRANAAVAAALALVKERGRGQP